MPQYDFEGQSFGGIASWRMAPKELSDAQTHLMGYSFNQNSAHEGNSYLHLVSLAAQQCEYLYLRDSATLAR